MSALVGALVVVGVLAATGSLGGAKTNVTTVQAAVPTATNAAAHESGALTPHEIYTRDAPGVVFITSTEVEKAEGGEGLFGGGEQSSRQGVATGSGIVIDGKGTILTNYHVIAKAVKVTVSFEQGKTVEAQIVGKDPSDDLAVLRVPTEGLDLHPLTLGNSAAVQIGEPAYAIGNPFDLQRTLTSGIISALRRELKSPNEFTIRNVLQTDAAINPGNSGGPLIDAAGRVIGINSQIETGGSGSNGNIGIGFAIPINTAKSVLSQLEKGGTVTGPYLGVSTVTVGASLKALHLPVKEGALVEGVEPKSAAGKAGLKGGNTPVRTEAGPIASGGDIIVEVDGKKVSSSEELANLISSKSPGQKVKITYLRPTGSGGYQKHTVEVTLGSRPLTGPKFSQTG